MFAGALIAGLAITLIAYGWPGGRTSAFGLPVGPLPDVFGVGRRKLRGH